jgi:hypothetical protein
MSEVMIVDPKILPKSPKAFRQYVETFFEEKQILGQKCLVAARVISGRGGKGVAPSHSLDLSIFKDGLPAGVSLSEWIQRETKKEAGIWSLYGPDPDPHPIDDD